MTRIGQRLGLIWLLCLLAALVLVHGCADSPGSTATPTAPAAAAPPSPEDVPPEVGPWLDAHAKRFEGTHLSLPPTDVEFLRDNLRLFLREVDPVAADKVTVQLNCLGRFANGPDGWRSFPEYDDQSSEYHAACGAALNETWDGFLLMRDKYEALVGEEDYEVALQNLRLAVQYHLWTADERGRGESMAENVEWIRRRSGPQHRILLWADNYHASTEPGGMGAHLREAFGDEFLTVGFSHERGRFVGVYRSETPNPGFAAFDLDAPIAGSFEHYLSSASYPQFLLDLRDLDAIQVGGARFAETRAFRFIGINYEPAMPESFWVQTPLSVWYDVLIHVKTTRPSVLPLRFPDSF